MMLEMRNVLVEILVVQYLHDGLIHVLFQVSQVHHHSSFFINWAPDSYLNWEIRKF